MGWYRVVTLNPGRPTGEVVNVAVFCFGERDDESFGWAQLTNMARASWFTNTGEDAIRDYLAVLHGDMDATDNLGRYTHYPHYMSVFGITEPLYTAAANQKQAERLAEHFLVEGDRAQGQASQEPTLGDGPSDAGDQTGL